MKPKSVLFFLISVYAALAVLMQVFPEGGIPINKNLSLQFITYAEFLGHNKVEKADISDILLQSDAYQLDDQTDEPLDIDTDRIDTLKKSMNKAEKLAQIHHLEFPEGDKTVLYTFWKRLEQLPQGNELLRILHYGDSQIEGDRITGFIRNKLQTRFGGFGVGLRPLRQSFDFQASLNQVNEGDWQRFTIFGLPDSTLAHNQYGALASFSRFSPLPLRVAVPTDIFNSSPEITISLNPTTISAKPKLDSTLLQTTQPKINTDSTPSESPKQITISPATAALEKTEPKQTYHASVRLSASKLAYPSARNFQHVRLYYSHAPTSVQVQISSNDTLLFTETLPTKNDRLGIKTIDFDRPLNDIQLEFNTDQSPDFYGITLDAKHGIAVDNVGMRGSAGTIFKKMDSKLLSAMYQDLNVGLVILQFGGNVTPYMRENYNYYENAFYSQIKHLQALIPGVSVIVIGPADMSRKEKDDYISYDNIPAIANALRSATFRAGGAYWDMYQAMGGENSMPSWVDHDPPLAEKDYTHFNPRGARVIAEMFYKAFIYEYEAYREQKRAIATAELFPNSN